MPILEWDWSPYDWSPRRPREAERTEPKGKTEPPPEGEPPAKDPAPAPEAPGDGEQGAMTQLSVKQLLHQAAEQLPPEATLEDAMERLLLLAKIHRRRLGM